MVRLAIVLVVAVVAGIWAYRYTSSKLERADAQYQDGMRLMGPGEYAEAVRKFTRALEINPQLAEAYVDRGIAHRYLNETDQAMADFDHAIGLNPNLARAYAARGTIYRLRGDTGRALDDFTKSLALSPNVDAFYERGQTYDGLGDPRKAIDDYNQAIAALPKGPYLYRARALAKHHLGDIAGYEADRDQATRLEQGPH